MLNFLHVSTPAAPYLNLSAADIPRLCDMVYPRKTDSAFHSAGRIYKFCFEIMSDPKKVSTTPGLTSISYVLMPDPVYAHFTGAKTIPPGLDLLHTWC
jgi:hypothetical protein